MREWRGEGVRPPNPPHTIVVFVFVFVFIVIAIDHHPPGARGRVGLRA
jgi:hypothetical protein